MKKNNIDECEKDLFKEDSRIIRFRMIEDGLVGFLKIVILRICLFT